MRTTFQAVLKGIIMLVMILIAFSCSSPQEKKALTLYNTHCASCHLRPAIEDLPKSIWKNCVLPDMAARMGIIDSTNNPFKRLSYDEQYAIKLTGIYAKSPLLQKEDWNLLKDYIIAMAPESLPSITRTTEYHELSQFEPRAISFDRTPGAFITYLGHRNKKHIVTADLNGTLTEHDILTGTSWNIAQTGEAITDYSEKNDIRYITHTGYLNPSEMASGNIQIQSSDTLQQLPNIFHRPVHTLIYDLNNNGHEELVVSEFGNLTGALSLLTKVEGQGYVKKVLLNRPGAIRTIAKDMNNDGKVDLITLAAQGKESVIILYQQNNLEFRADPVIKFSPVYGTSWFDLVDYNGDGHDDIITVNGDNADKSYVHKPYHGLRIHMNDGANQFEEKYFYPMNGATRSVAQDFDKDGDIDFGILSTFPDYTTRPEHSFVYLENQQSERFQFKPFTFKDSKLGRWLLMDTVDFDQDGDDDIILSSFTYSFTPVPEHISAIWDESNVDVMVLKNELYP